MDKKVYTVKDISAILGIGISKGYDLIHEKQIPYTRMGRKIIIPKKAFEIWLDNVCLQES